MEQFQDNKAIKVELPFSYRLARKNFLSNCVCNSPSTNVFIDAKGNVFPCCFNRTYPWGNLLRDGIDAINKSSVRHELKNKLKHNDVSMGCLYCYNVIKVGNYKAAGSIYYDHKLFGPKPFPASIEFELDTFCNLDCVMCSPTLHSSSPQKNFGSDFVDKITPWLKNLRWSKFLGGEPFLIPVYYEIWERIIEVNPDCKITVQTNATVLNDRLKALLDKGKFHISVSLDSMNEETYNNIRRNASFTKVMNNIDWFLKYTKRKKTTFNISVCPMRQNINEIPELVKFAYKSRAYINFNLLLYPRSYSLRYMDWEELDSAVELYKESNINGIGSIDTEIKRNFNSLVKQVESWRDEARVRRSIPDIATTKSEIVKLLVEKLKPAEQESARVLLEAEMSGLEEEIVLRKDIFDKICSLTEDKVRKFILNQNIKEQSERIDEIMRFGF